MIFKIRRLQNNRDIDVLCEFFTALSMENIPKSMKSIQQQLCAAFDLNKLSECYHICSNCGSSSSDNVKACQSCPNAIIVKFYLCSIKQQIQQLLAIPGFYSKLKEEKLKNIYSFSNTKYGEILKEIANDSFTMIINTDGVCTPNKNLSLWPFVLILNELPVRDRRYLENVTIAGIIPTGKKPSNSVVQTCLRLIHDQLNQLELGQEFYINDIDERKILQFHTIASCTDKPAEALMENVVPFNAEYGCPKCFTRGMDMYSHFSFAFHFMNIKKLSYLHLGELYHGERGVGEKTRKFTIRIYPYGDYELRTQDKCLAIIEELASYPNQPNDSTPTHTQQKKTPRKGKKEKKKSLFGHFGKTLLQKNSLERHGHS